MTLFFFCLFAGAVLVHLVSLFFKNDRFKALTKGCLLPLLLALYLVMAKQPLAVVVLAIVLGWLGDVLFLWSERRLFFILGLASFLLGHLAYITAFLLRLPALHLPALAVSGAAALVLAAAVLRYIRPDRSLLVPVIIYTIVLEAMGLFALQLALYRRDLPAWAIFAGSLCFLISDSFLAWFIFRATQKNGHFRVMLFYIIAQFFIVWGLSAI